ncbi:unnamed protein product, partial [Meganyctiphanes norvegica]
MCTEKLPLRENYDKPVKEEIEVFEEPELKQDAEIQVKEETRVHVKKIHQRTHIGEKTFPGAALGVGNKCDQAFSDKSNLTRHQNKHSGEKQYQCNQCYMTFLKN